jgi:hypothetical protein
VVLDQEHRQLEAVSRARDERAELIDLLVAEATGRLVEQKQARRRDERARKLDPLPRRVREPGDRPVREPLQVEVLEGLAHP